MSQNASMANAQAAFQALFASLKKQESDAKVWERMELLRKRGVSTEAIVAQVVKSVGSPAGVRCQQITKNRNQLLATGTMQRYKPSRWRRFKRWLRNLAS